VVDVGYERAAKELPLFSTSSCPFSPLPFQIIYTIFVSMSAPQKTDLIPCPAEVLTLIQNLHVPAYKDVVHDDAVKVRATNFNL
jgi:hypothetical protein